MENIVPLLVPAILALMVMRMLLLPLKWTVRVGLHSACGFLCLWLLNTASAFTGIRFPMNAVTVFTAGTLGLPGIGLLAALTML